MSGVGDCETGLVGLRRNCYIAAAGDETAEPLVDTGEQPLDVFGLASLKDLPKPEEFGLSDADD